MTDSKQSGLSAAELAEELASLSQYVETGSYPRPPRLEPRELAVIVADLAEAAAARATLARDRPVRPKQLAALARVNTERLRQLPRTEEGFIAPDAARDWLQASGVADVASRSFDVTPTWWKSTIPGDRLRRAADAVLRRGLPAPASIATELATVTVSVPGGQADDDGSLRGYLLRVRSELEQLKPR